MASETASHFSLLSYFWEKFLHSHLALQIGEVCMVELGIIFLLLLLASAFKKNDISQALVALLQLPALLGIVLFGLQLSFILPVSLQISGTLNLTKLFDDIMDTGIPVFLGGITSVFLLILLWHFALRSSVTSDKEVK